MGEKKVNNLKGELDLFWEEHYEEYWRTQLRKRHYESLWK